MKDLCITTIRELITFSIKMTTIIKISVRANNQSMRLTLMDISSIQGWIHHPFSRKICRESRIEPTIQTKNMTYLGVEYKSMSISNCPKFLIFHKLQLSIHTSTKTMPNTSYLIRSLGCMIQTMCMDRLTPWCKTKDIIGPFQSVSHNCINLCHSNLIHFSSEILITLAPLIF